MKKNTTPKKLLDAINNKKLSVIGGKIYSVDMVRNYPPDQFVEELEFLCESGCFAEMIDIKYEVAVGHVLLDIGRMCAKDIYALMQLDVADGVTPQEIKCGLCMKVTLKTILPLSGQGLHPSKKIISSRKLLPLL